MTISRSLRKLGPPRQKKVPRAQEQDRPEVQQQRREFREELAGLDPRRLIKTSPTRHGGVGLASLSSGAGSAGRRPSARASCAAVTTAQTA